MQEKLPNPSTDQVGAENPVIKNPELEKILERARKRLGEMSRELRKRKPFRRDKRNF